MHFYEFSFLTERPLLIAYCILYSIFVSYERHQINNQIQKIKVVVKKIKKRSH